MDALSIPGLDRHTRVLLAIDAGECMVASGNNGVLGYAIADNGPGIPAELLPSLLEPFASSRLDAKGTGLGLAVADGIVREHGGVLIARNRGGGGAVFEVLLPAFESAGAMPRPSP